MSIVSFDRPSKPCWRVPTGCCFASWGNIDALTAVRDACVYANECGMDDSNGVLQLMISNIDQADRKTPHQIPIA
jgi:hypothetical protein